MTEAKNIAPGFTPANERHGQPTTNFRCGKCGELFTSKGAKRRHKQAGCQPDDESVRVASIAPVAVVDDAGKFGRPWEHITPAIKALAAAEWEAMDAIGRLPDGWHAEYARKLLEEVCRG